MIEGGRAPADSRPLLCLPPHRPQAWKTATAARPPVLELHLKLDNPGFPYPRPVAGSPFRPRIVTDDASPLLSTLRLTAYAHGDAAGSGGDGAPPPPPPPPRAPAVPPEVRSGRPNLCSHACSSSFPLPPPSQEDPEVVRLRQELAAKDAAMAQGMAEMHEMR